MYRDSQISNRKLTLPIIKNLSIHDDLVPIPAKTKQFTHRELSIFLDPIVTRTSKELTLDFLLFQCRVPLKEVYHQRIEEWIVPSEQMRDHTFNLAIKICTFNHDG